MQFEPVIPVSQHPDLHILISVLDGLSTLLGSVELRVQDHDSALCGQEQTISALKTELDKLKKEPMLCLPGVTPGVKLIGREDELADFARKTATEGKICVVCGIGGLGKTEFIKAYLQEHIDTFGRVGWFE